MQLRYLDGMRLGNAQLAANDELLGPSLHHLQHQRHQCTHIDLSPIVMNLMPRPDDAVEKGRILRGS